MGAYTRDELALIGRWQKETGRAPPPALAQLMERRRAGVDDTVLRAEAMELFKADLVGRAIVLRWLGPPSAPGSSSAGAWSAPPAATVLPGARVVPAPKAAAVDEPTSATR